jgi:hypothetical protein
MIRESLNIVTGVANGLTTIIYVGQPFEERETAREKALDVIYNIGAEDAYKDELRKSLKVETINRFMDKF